MKKMISLTLSLVLLLSIGIPVSAVNTASATENEVNANTYHTNLVTHYEQNGSYPNHYGGSYISENTGNLIINLTERSPDIEASYYAVCNAETLEFQTVQYSLNELFNFKNQAVDFLKSEETTSVLSPTITGSTIIQKSNQVEIYIAPQQSSSYSIDGQIQPFTSLEMDSLTLTLDSAFDFSDAIVLKSSSGELQLEASAGSPGYGLKQFEDSADVPGSIGYLAYRMVGSTRESGYVTAGHVLTPYPSLNNPVYNTNGERIGICMLSVPPIPTGDLTLSGAGDLDFAFVKLDAGTGISTNVRGTSYPQDLSTQHVIPAEGATIYKSGNVTGVTSGTVYTLYYDTTQSHTTGPYVRRILSTYGSSEGDSGSIVYTVANGKARVVGIHQGKPPAINGTTYVSVISAYHIQNSDYQVIAG